MHEENYLASVGMPLDCAVRLCHTARRDGMLDEVMEQINKVCDPKHKCSCNPPCAHCSCQNR